MSRTASIVSCCLCLGLALGIASSPCYANLAITMNKLPTNEVYITWTGSGTIDGDTSTGIALNFNNFGQFFDSGSTPTLANFSLSAPLTLEGVDASASSSYTNNYNTLRLVDEAVSDDLASVGSSLSVISLTDGDTYTASGSAMVVGLAASTLTNGFYTATGGPDLPLFNPVTLTIRAIPEPSATLFGGLMAVSILAPRSVWPRKREASDLD